MDLQEISQRQDALIKVMQSNGSLHSPAVEAAFRTVPRHWFLPDEPLKKVYADVAIAVKRGSEGLWTSSSSQPSMMAIMLEQLDFQPGMRVLEIGTGSGYNAALMAALVGPQGSVTSVDIQPDLVENARERLAAAGFGRVQVINADGGNGYPPNAPYDRIILTVAAWTITPAWREQLLDGGRLVLPLSLEGTQKSVAFERHGAELVSLSLSDCGFMHLQGSFAEPTPARAAVGGDEHLLLTLPPGSTFDAAQQAERLAAWLEAPNLLQTGSGVSTQLVNIWAGLYLWLNLHARENQEASRMATLEATAERAGDAAIPALMGFGGEWKRTETLLLLETDSMAALMRPPADPLTFIDWNDPDAHPPKAPFEIYVRSLGGSEAAKRLLELVQRWDAAGQPGTHRLHLRALPAEADAGPRAGEFVLEKPWMKLFLHYDEG